MAIGWHPAVLLPVALQHHDRRKHTATNHATSLRCGFGIQRSPAVRYEWNTRQSVHIMLIAPNRHTECGKTPRSTHTLALAFLCGPVLYSFCSLPFHHLHSLYLP